MRVLQIIDTLNRGGAERVLVDMSNLLALQGHQVHVLTLVGAGPMVNELGKTITTSDLQRRNKYSLKKAKEFMKLVNEHEIVHLHMRHVLNYYFFCQLFLKVRSKIVFQDHNGDIALDKHVPAYVRWLKDKIYYVGVSRALTEWASELAGFHPSRIFLLPNIVLVDIKKRINPSSGKILMISNFRRTKHIEFALLVLGELVKRHFFILDIYGRVQDQNYLEELKAMASTLNLGKNVNFIINEANVRDKIGSYNAAIHTATSETGPLVLIEYLAYQLPFLSYRTGEVPAQIGASLPDYFCDDFDQKRWAEKLLDLLSGKINYPFEQIKELFDRYYSPERYVRACEEIYAKVLKHGGK